MRQSNHRILPIVAIVVWILALAFAPAHAAITDAPAATESNALLNAGAPLNWVQPQANLSCGPSTQGYVVTDHSDRIWEPNGSLTINGVGSEAAVANGVCTAFTGESYTAQLWEQIEYYETDKPLGNGQWFFGCYCWKQVSGTQRFTPILQSVDGVVVFPTWPTGRDYWLGQSDPALGYYHQAHAWITTSLPGTTPVHAYSWLTWYMNP